MRKSLCKFIKFLILVTFLFCFVCGNLFSGGLNFYTVTLGIIMIGEFYLWGVIDNVEMR